VSSKSTSDLEESLELGKLSSKISFFPSDFYLIDLLKKTVSMVTCRGAQHRWRERWTLEDAAFVSACWDVCAGFPSAHEACHPNSKTWLKASSIIALLIHYVQVSLGDADLHTFYFPSDPSIHLLFHPSLIFLITQREHFAQLWKKINFVKIKFCSVFIVWYMD